MTINEAFCQCLDCLEIQNKDDIEKHIKGITKKLNQRFYESNSDTEHCLLVGSMGRKTSIDKESDIDIIFELPRELLYNYKNRQGNGPSQLLSDIRDCLLDRYSNTDIRGDGQVVDVFFTDYTVEIVPGFRESDDSFTYPDSNNGGSWPKTNPIPEQETCEEMDSTFLVFRDCCKLLRAWKAENDVKCGGLLIDTLVYNYFQENPDYQKIKRGDFDFENVFPELLAFFSSQDKEQQYWLALGSRQFIYNKEEYNFIPKSKKALQMLNDCEDDEDAKWALFQTTFGDVFPSCPDEKIEGRSEEQFVNRLYPVEIKNNLKIDCEVTQDGFRPFFLAAFLADIGTSHFLKYKKSLHFFIKSTNVRPPYEIYWKVRNVGKTAIKKKMIRGQIIEGTECREEHTSFNGPHYVECYIIKDDICVARDRLYVPIHDDYFG